MYTYLQLALPFTYEPQPEVLDPLAELYPEADEPEPELLAVRRWRRDAETARRPAWIDRIPAKDYTTEVTR